MAKLHGTVPRMCQRAGNVYLPGGSNSLIVRTWFDIESFRRATLVKKTSNCQFKDNLDLLLE